MKKHLPDVLKVIFVLVLIGFVLVHKQQTPRILIVHSYLNDYGWVEEINEGFKRVFDKHPELILRYHYMDLKNHPEQRYREISASNVHKLIKEWEPNIIVLVDDHAQKLIGTEYLHHPEVKLVFAGVNADIEKYGYDKADNVTGILERKPLHAIKETALMILAAQGKNIQGEEDLKMIFIGDKSANITLQIPYFENYDWSPIRWMPPIQADTFKEWKQAVTETGDKYDIIMVANYHQIRPYSGSNEFIRPVDTVMTWTEKNSKIPVIGTGSGNVAEGGMLTVPVSGYEQGEVAGQMAIDISKGVSPKDIPVTSTKQFLISVRKSAMERRQLPIPSIYEAFARATEKYYE
ncbi:MAG: hypothetical protein GY749_42470 [Desulfobacteraceae bacterium]|nr:hypothetical protein [Desulfobacteraceae bacterium]